MAREVRVSVPMLKLLRAMMENPRKPYSGADVGRATGLGAGTIYPLLQRLEHAGWLNSKWEDVDPSEVGRPRRRHYTLTGIGQTQAAKALADVQVPAGALAWNT